MECLTTYSNKICFRTFIAMLLVIIATEQTHIASTAYKMFKKDEHF